MADVTKKRWDGWRNLIAGLGGRQDKRQHTETSPYKRILDQELVTAYVDDGLARNVVDMPADDMTRQWISVADDPDGLIADGLSTLNAETAFNEALKWARLKGGGFIVMGAMDGQTLDKPLNLERVTGVEWLYVGDRSQVSLGQSKAYDDPTKPEFGQVEKYAIRFVHSAGAKASDVKMVHASRVLPFYGELVPKTGEIALDTDAAHWGISSLQAVWDKLADMGGVSGATVNLMYELVLTVYRMAGLAEMLAEGQEKLVTDRMEVIGLTKSMINGVLLDERESVERITASIAGVPEVLDRYMILTSAVSRIPVTRLFGRSPAGLNATGESDTEAYYDSIRAKQKNELQEPLQKLVDVLAVALKVPGETHVISFNPLKQETPKQASERRKDDTASLKSAVDAMTALVEAQVLGQEEALAVLKAMAQDFPALAALPEATGA